MRSSPGGVEQRGDEQPRADDDRDRVRQQHLRHHVAQAQQPADVDFQAWPRDAPVTEPLPQ